MRATADLWIATWESYVMATRGERLVLMRGRFSDPDQRPEAFLTELLGIFEINADEQIVTLVSFDADDIAAALEELDARYLAGEAAAHSHTWSVISRAYAAFNRHELPPTTPDSVLIDHRPVVTIEALDLAVSVRSTWDVTPDISICIEAVHQLSELGAVVTHTLKGNSPAGFNAEWRVIEIFTVEGDRVNRCEIFDEADLDAALARFEELHPQTRLLENAATEVTERFLAHFAAGGWDAMPEMMADNFSSDDRRRVVGAGVRHGRDAQIMDMRAIADLGITNGATTHMATRGERLALSRTRISGRDQRPGAFYGEMLDVLEINADAQIVAYVVFDLDEIDAAFEELDARYLAGEAAPYARAWSVITGACAALSRGELFPTTPDWVNIDHRRGIAFAPGDLTAYIRTAWDLLSDGGVYIETAHRLSNLGAVFTWAGYGNSQEGVNVEFRGINILTVEGDRINLCEIFDETDLDAALARFDELHPQARRLENAESRVAERFLAQFAARNWDAMAEMLADDYFSDDRRRVVGAGVRHGRDAQIADMRAIADLWITNVRSTVIATRGERLALTRTGFSGRDQGSEAFRTEVLTVAEINTGERAVASVSFDLDDLDAAFEELDARYLAGEAAAHSHTWSVIAGTYATVNRREIPATTPDWVNLDHRRAPAFAPGDGIASLRATWDLAPDFAIHVETVHRLTDLGAVFTYAAYGASQRGFDAEWRGVNMLTVEGELISRCEIFDEEDIDAALARFEELRPHARRLENAASRVDRRLIAYFNARDLDAMAEMMPADFCSDDRRRVVNAGLVQGREVAIANFRATAELGVTLDRSDVIATRGERLVLSRARWTGPDQRPEAFHSEVLNVVEINANERITAHVMFDPDAFDAAFEELDTRYLAGEAAAHARPWSVITATYAAFNQHELARTDWVVSDHRRGALFASSNMTASVRAFWDQTPDLSIHIEAVHRVSDFGAVVTHTADGTSPEGFAAEWRMIQVLTVEGDQVDRCELFDEADLDAALARFEELHPQTHRLENVASRVSERFQAPLAARNWDAMAEMLAVDTVIDDRRRVVGSGVHRGRDVDVANMRATSDIGIENVTSTVVATRGERLILSRVHFSRRDELPEPFYTEILRILEIDAEERIAARVFFDPEQINAAFEELDARYLAGDAAAHAHAWSLISSIYAGFNRHELPATTPDFTYIDHRPLITIDASDLPASIGAVWKLTPDISTYIEAVHRLSDLGAVVTHTARGISHEGFDAEWRMVNIFTVDGDLVSRCEMFDEADLDAALARFEELSPLPPPTAGTA
jgi:hypothetical protein